MGLEPLHVTHLGQALRFSCLPGQQNVSPQADAMDSYPAQRHQLEWEGCISAAPVGSVSVRTTTRTQKAGEPTPVTPVYTSSKTSGFVGGSHVPGDVAGGSRFS